MHTDERVQRKISLTQKSFFHRSVMWMEAWKIKRNQVYFLCFFPGSCSFLCRNKMCILKHSVIMIIRGRFKSGIFLVAFHPSNSLPFQLGPTICQTTTTGNTVTSRRKNQMRNSTKNLKVTSILKYIFLSLFFFFLFCRLQFDRVLSTIGRQRRAARGASDKDVTPPLLAKVQGNLEVQETLNQLGFGFLSIHLIFFGE